uniref:Uncharacterized protein n=1 Tax=Globodera rostochiensis TaxID=31243 RepID=A0A914HCB7_GLORO
MFLISSSICQQHPLHHISATHKIFSEIDFIHFLSFLPQMTHGFGGLAVHAVLETMIRVINECNGVLNRNYQSTAGQMAAPSGTFNP